jgi:hypothetical protein
MFENGSKWPHKAAVVAVIMRSFPHLRAGAERSVSAPAPNLAVFSLTLSCERCELGELGDDRLRHF